MRGLGVQAVDAAGLLVAEEAVLVFVGPIEHELLLLRRRLRIGRNLAGVLAHGQRGDVQIHPPAFFFAKLAFVLREGGGGTPRSVAGR